MERKKVKIVHPEAGESWVFEAAVPAWRASGWELAEDPETDTAGDKPSAGQQRGQTQHSDSTKTGGRSHRRSSGEDE